MTTHDPSSYMGQEKGWCVCDQPSGQPGSSCEACEGMIQEPIDGMRRRVVEQTAHALVLSPDLISEDIGRAMKGMAGAWLKVGHRCQITDCACQELDQISADRLPHPPPFHDQCDCVVEAGVALERARGIVMEEVERARAGWASRKVEGDG